MATMVQLRAALGSAWHVNSEAFLNLIASDGNNSSAGGFTSLTATGAVTFGAASTFGAFGAAAVAQPAGAAQGAITDSSGGTANAATGVAANGPKESLYVPITALSAIANSQAWTTTAPFAGVLTAMRYRTLVPTTTNAKGTTFTARIATAAVTGGVLAVASNTDTGTVGASKASTAITAGNTFTAGQTIEAFTSATTAFIEGSGMIEFDVINSDAANTTATILNLLAAVRSALVTLGLIKGAA